MSTLPETVYVLIDGDPFLAKALAFRAAEMDCRRAWAEFGRSMGASGVPSAWAGERPTGLIFSDKPPKGWLVPVRGSRTSKPDKRNDAARAAMAALPARPRSNKVFGKAIIGEVTSESQGCQQGHGIIGFMIEGPSIGWAGDIMFALIPHAGNAAANVKAKSPGAIITNGADKWVVPAGLTEVSKAEIDLLIAERTVAAERAARVAPTPTASREVTAP